MSTEPRTTFTSQSHVYAAVRELGKGGQGRTVLVEREGEPGSSFVLKLLRLEHVDDWKQVELFEREVATLAALDHPGIPRLVDRLEEDGRTTGIVQTFVDGHTLAEQIAAHGPLGAARFEQILRECLEILAHLHEQVPPVMHRDINPRNVMLGPDRTYLIDFGAVRVGGKTDMTSVGTFGYMAPEQLIGRPVPASDVYGLGMTMVSLAERRDVGDLPHDPSTGRVDVTRLLRSVEPRVRDVVLAMIEPGVGERLASPREALRRLDAPPVPAMREEAELERAAAGPGRLPLRIGLALGILGLTAVAGLTFTSSKQSESRGPSIQVEPPQVVIAPPPIEPSKPPPRQVEPKLVRPAPVEPPKASPELLEPPPPEPAELTDENSAQLRIITKPSNAMVFLDGKGTCYTPCARRVAFGRHDVRLEHGERAVDRSVRVLEDTVLQVSMVE